MIIRIIGATGFIGKNLEGYFRGKRYGIGTLSLRKEGWQHDLGQPNIIINLVGKAHDHKGTATEGDYYYANVELAQEIFRVFVNSSADLLIHVSSLAALEEFAADMPLTEDHACNPVSWYGKSKREAEEWLLSQTLPPNKKLIVLRPPMVHGRGDKGNLGLLYKLISKGIPYPLSSFKNSRSFISIDNFSFLVHQIIEKQNNLESGIYHVADDEPVSTRDIITIIKQITGKHVPDIALPKFLVKGLAKMGDIIPIPMNTKRLKKMTSDLLVSNAKIKQALGIEKLPLTAEEGLVKTIRSFKN